MHKTHDSALISLRATLPKARFLASSDVRAASCSAEWQACRPGDVFFALTTAEGDGHEHAAAAIERGAVAVVAERLLAIETPQVLVRDTRSAFARVCQALAGHPSRQLATIGVTGSAGKTVTSILLASMLEAVGQSVGVLSSIGRSDSVVQRVAPSGTPTAAEFAAWLRRMKTAGCDSAVLELSSRALAERRTSGLALDAAVLTNIQIEHLDEHNTARAYAQIKRRIFRHLKPSGIAVINADDHRCRGLLSGLDAATLTYALHAEADITAQVVERSISEQTFVLTAGEESSPVRTRMIGDHHVSACLAAAAVGLSLGIDLATIVSGLEAVKRVPGRMERLECGQPFGVFVDAARTPETLSRSIATLRQVTRGRVLVVFGAPENADAARRAMLGRVLERGCHLPILTCDLPQPMEPLHSIHELLDGFQRPHKAHNIPERSAAIRFALSQAQPGDAVLIAGRGDRGSEKKGRAKLTDDDREIACAWLYEPPVEHRRFRIVG
jgi:UDP-N-acetylmuramoyl-L-alanyl-D-glutamate--2,6-diaminopimelate ligase